MLGEEYLKAIGGILEEIRSTQVKKIAEIAELLTKEKAKLQVFVSPSLKASPDDHNERVLDSYIQPMKGR